MVRRQCVSGCRLYSTWTHRYRTSITHRLRCRSNARVDSYLRADTSRLAIWLRLCMDLVLFPILFKCTVVFLMFYLFAVSPVSIEPSSRDEATNVASSFNDSACNQLLPILPLSIGTMTPTASIRALRLSSSSCRLRNALIPAC